MGNEQMTTRCRLSDARLPGMPNPVDIDVEEGRVVAIRSCSARSTEADRWGPPAESSGSRIERMDGMLLIPSLREHHSHLDKVLTADTIVNRTGDLMGAIGAWAKAENSGILGLEEMQIRAESAIERMLYSGVTSIRTHVNVGDSDPELRNLRAVAAARDRFRGVVDIEIVALMQSPLTGPDGLGNRAALDRAVEFGIDFIGGCPHLEIDSPEAIKHLLDLAEAADLGIDLHMDESLDPDVLTVELLAREVLSRGCSQHVAASHCVSLSVQSEDRQRVIAALLHSARITVVALPQTNLFLQGWKHPQSMPRGIAPLQLLADHGVGIAAGGDNVQDPFNPMGRFDPLETASLLVTAAHLSPRDALRAVSADSTRWEDPERDLIGAPANFLAIDALNIREALASAPMTRTTIRGGHIIATTKVESRMISPG